MSHNRARAAVCILFLLSLAGAASAFPRPAAGQVRVPETPVPETLILEVVTAPGYNWMEACLQAGGEAGAAGSAGPAAGIDHAAHHPPRALPGSPLDGAGLEETIAALDEMMDAVSRLRSGKGEAPAPRRRKSSQ